MPIFPIVILAVIQGLAELLPVSSSAHVVVAEILMGLDPSSPAMTFLLVMLHMGTSLAVILYFWPRWRQRLLAADQVARMAVLRALIIATGVTGVVGLALKHLIETVFMHGHEKKEIEMLFSNLPLMSAALACVGVLIIWAGRRPEGGRMLDSSAATRIGLIQGLCLPFRGFSRSGATISAALLCGIPREVAEDFSFALSIILTPPVIAREVHRLLKSVDASAVTTALFLPGLLGMVFSFCAGLVALKWLSQWLEKGRWSYFGWYCLAVSVFVFGLSRYHP